MVSIPGYSIKEQLYNGSRTLVYRGVRECDQKPVVIKLLKNPYPSFNELLQFRNQYTIAKNLEIPGIIRLYVMESYRNSYVLVMEDFGGVSLREYMQTNGVSIKDILSILVQITDILHNVHQKRVIHKDIKPANILINPQTGEIKLIDFSIASLLPKENQEIKNPHGLEGTLPYISPEQTGRMNRGIDYRADFYALGVTFYELLTGKLPFKSDDAMELVHCHIAQAPPEINSKEIPHVLSDIVIKLMAKNAEDRYQSSLGLKHDLEICLIQLRETGKIENFKISQRDVSDRFIIPEKLYGREQEVKTLLEAFERVSGIENHSKAELMLVAGFSGIGKTALINEIHKPIVKGCGYFIKGKFDQFNRNIPLNAFVQAFRNLIGQLRTESDAQLLNWKNKILQALGDSAQVIIEVIPSLEKIIGKQSPVPELSGTAAEIRFNLLFQKFIKVFTTKEHPLVIFLDDLQWADSASLNLIKLLMSEYENGYLLFIGAYRDNEVYTAHPLMLTLSEINKSEATINTIRLAALREQSLNQLVGDTLNCLPEIARTLTQLIYQKTQGNPFFSTQFLKALHEDGLINFDFEHGYWRCDISKLRETALTDDVVEFMALQLQKLPESTQNILKLAACIGNQFDLATLAIVCQKSETETATDLWKALQLGLILPQSEIYKFYLHSETDNQQLENSQIVNYKFLHDRVQQAAYSLIPENQKQATHYQIGQLLKSNISNEALESRIFELLSQLNPGLNRIIHPDEKQELAHLNLIAARKAKISAAYEPALKYCNIGINLLSINTWKTDYKLALTLHELAAESAYLCGNNELFEKYVEAIINHAKNALDRISIDEIRIQAYTVQNRFIEALEIAKQSLQEWGIFFPKDISLNVIQQELKETQKCLATFTLNELETLPKMTEVTALASMRLLSSIIATSYIAEPSLFPLIILRMVQCSLQYGNTSSSPYAYACYGILLVNLAKDTESLNKLGELALTLLEKSSDRVIEARTKLVVAGHLYHWKFHFQKSLPLAQESYQIAFHVGDLEYVGYSAQIISFGRYFIGQLLPELEKDVKAYCHTLAKLNQVTSLRYCQIYWQALLNLLGSNSNPSVLMGEAFNEQDIIPILTKANDRTGLYHFYCNKLILCYLFGNLEEALIAAKTAKIYEDSLAGMFIIPTCYFYQSLILLENHTKLASQPDDYLQQIESNRVALKSWAQSSPCNHQHRFDLVEAEYYRVFEQPYQAMEYYDRAIAGAKANDYIHEEALGNELAAKLYLSWGKETVASGYMLQAYYCYAKWGAKTKTDDLEKRYPRLLQTILQQRKLNIYHDETIAGITRMGTLESTHTSSTGITSVSDLLDFTSVLKAAQAISGSIELDQLITNLTKIILENSGAKKSVLILPQKNTWFVKVVTFINYVNKPEGEIQSIILDELVDKSEYIPIKIINYVKNTLNTVVINNSQTEIPGLIGEYMLKHQPKSLLCKPIVNQGHLVAVLYLENQITSGVFTLNNLQVINLLSSQAAISLENARLYQQAQQALQDLQQAQLKIVQSEKMSALGNLVAGVAHEMNNPLGFIASTLKQAKPIFTDISEYLKLYQESFPNKSEEILVREEEIDLDYTLEDFPKMMDAMVIASDRLKNISTSLRTFSRADKDYKVSFNIHHGLDSTILILKHRLKANEQRPAIEVVKEYGNLPSIECFPGQLNQVFMNILANAIDALDESNTERNFDEIQTKPNQIIVKTLVENNQVKISIADNAKGMSEDIKQKIFDHLFTTKNVGKGTGLGLAIARQIVVEKHGGSIEVNSVPNQGTEFTICLTGI